MKLFFDFPSSQIVMHLGLRLDPGVNEVSEDHGKALLALAPGIPVREATGEEAEAHAQAVTAREAELHEARQKERQAELEAERAQPTEPVLSTAPKRRRGTE